MATIAEQLTSLADAKSAIKSAIVSRGVSVSDTDPLRTYADKIGQIGETVPETRFGVGIGNILGTVDADGKLSKPADIEEVNLVGVKNIDNNVLEYAFAGKEIKYFTANDVENVSSSALQNCFYSSNIKQASFDGIEEINGSFAFSSCFAYCYLLTYLSFKKLKKINGTGIFNNALLSASALTMTYDEIFPSLEEVYGNSTLITGRSYKANDVITFSKIKKITGGSITNHSTFGGFYAQNTVWNFPSVTEFTGYIWNVGSSYAGEIHFAAANQAAIEACEGYANKWGFQNATIYFDL